MKKKVLVSVTIFDEDGESGHMHPYKTKNLETVRSKG